VTDDRKWNIAILQGKSMWRVECECGWTDYMFFSEGEAALMEMTRKHVAETHKQGSTE